MTNTQAFLEAVTKGDQDSVEQMLSDDPTLVHARNANGVSAVLLAVYYGLPHIAHLLIARGVQPDIFEASATGMSGRIKELLETDPALANAYAPDGFQGLGLASFFGHLDAVQLLLDHGAEVNSVSHNGQQVMPLHSAVAGGHLEIARLLLAHGSDANAVQSDEFTPLHGAADNGQVEMVKLLLAYGADPRAKMRSGLTAYDLAVAKGHAEAAALLRL